jgi:hypothetical protein
MRFYVDKNEDNYQQVYENDNFEENKSSLGHEMIAGGAAFAGFKAFEDHQRKEGTWRLCVLACMMHANHLPQASLCLTNSPKSC